MGFIISLLMLALTLIQYLKYKSVINLQVLFPLFWFLICFFTSLGIGDIYTPSDFVYLYILASVIFFCLSSRFGFHIKRKSIETGEVSDVYWFREKLFWILLAIGLSVSIRQLMLLLPIILEYGIGAARNLLQSDPNVQLRSLAHVLYLYLSIPIIHAGIIIYIVKCFYEKFTIKDVSIVVVLTILSYVSDGNRLTILNTIIAIGFVFLNKKIKLSRRTKKRLLLLLALAVVLIIYSTIERGSRVLYTLYGYFCHSTVYFSKYYEEHIRNSELTLGAISFQGFLRPIFGTLNYIGLKEPHIMKVCDDFLDSLQSTSIMTSNSGGLNYYLTCFGYFAKDFGYWGAVIVPTIYGQICSWLEGYREKHKNNYQIICIEILMVQGVLTSMYMFPFADYRFVMCGVYLFVFTINTDRRKFLKFKIKR